MVQMCWIYPFFFSKGFLKTEGRNNAPLLHPAHKTRLNKICTKQNRCIRSMFFAHGREHVNPYYNLLGILKLENIYRLKVSLFTYKLKNDKSNTPAVLLNILTPASEIHSYNTRYIANQNFFKPSVHTQFWYSYI